MRELLLLIKDLVGMEGLVVLYVAGVVVAAWTGMRRP